MQPYFLPYLGYFQLIAASDLFVVYDDIKFTKKGWVNRNRFLRNGTDAVFSLPLSAASDDLKIIEREIADSFDPIKMLRQFEGAYAKSPNFADIRPLIELILCHPDRNLFGFLLHSLRQICSYLRIKTPFQTSSTVPGTSSQKGQDRVLAICERLDADRYLNLSGGRSLYDTQAFAEKSIQLEFIEMEDVSYPQKAPQFLPKLSILDVLAHVDRETVIRELLNSFRIEAAPRHDRKTAS